VPRAWSLCLVGASCVVYGVLTSWLRTRRQARHSPGIRRKAPGTITVVNSHRTTAGDHASITNLSAGEVPAVATRQMLLPSVDGNS
jgi:hypothetical protein